MKKLKNAIFMTAMSVVMGLSTVGSAWNIGIANTYSVSAATEVTEGAKLATSSDAENKNGLIKSNNKYYYYENGKKITEKLKTITVKENNKDVTYTYYFTKDGSAYSGLKRIDGNLYYFDDKNTSHPYAAIKGWKTVNSKKYYFSSKSAVAVKGLQKIGSYYYYFGNDNVMRKSKWVSLKSGRYYFGSNGHAYTGLKKISGYRFYFNTKGVMKKNTWKKINGKTYYFGSTGKAQTGIKKIGKYYYYFSSNGVMVKNKFVTVKGKKYYFGSNGRAYTGVHTVKGYKYYFNFSKKGYLTSGTVTVKGKQYRFRSTGRPYVGWYTSKSGNKYYYKANGTATTGSAIIGNKVYLFNTKGVLVASEGWHKVNGKTYYVENNGTLATGYKKIGDDYYYFSKKGVRYEKKWAYANGYKFYFGSTGKRLTDVSSIIGTQDSYNITINKTTNVVTVYAKDGNNGYIIPVKAFICSTGNATPLGTFYSPAKWRWLTLMGPCYGQWDTQISGNILFHSVYYSQTDANTLSVSAYNQLGTTCSHGCVRLTARDAKWIYDNCPIGTKITIFAKNEEGPFPKPSAYQLSSSHTWDPTDPNMYYKCRQIGCH